MGYFRRIISFGLIVTIFLERASAAFFNEGIISTIVGNGESTYVTTPTDATSISIYAPKELFVDNDLNVYFCEYGNYAIKKLVASTNKVITLAGNGSFSGTANVPYPGSVAATSVGFAFVHGVVKDSRGYIYFGTRSSESGSSSKQVNFMYRLNETSGQVSRMAGGVGNGAGRGNYLSLYEGYQSPYFRSHVLTLFIDSNDNIYSLDSFNARVYKISMHSEDNHTMATIAGNPTLYSGTVASKCANNGDGGLAPSAYFRNPEGVAVLPNGDVFVSDSGCGVIRKIDHATNIISTIAGAAFSFGVAVNVASFSDARFGSQIRTVAVDSLANIYVADSVNDVIRGLDFSHNNVYVVAGVPSVGGYNGDGLQATNAYLNIPWSVYIDSLGYAYIADASNNRIRKVVPMAPTGTPTGMPTGSPTPGTYGNRTRHPTGQPTAEPTAMPSCQPSSQPTNPTGQPTAHPSRPTSQPTSCPSSVPSGQPSTSPTNVPSYVPTMRPSSQPSSIPTKMPSHVPSSKPSLQPTAQPTGIPTHQPTSFPTTALSHTISFNVTHQLHDIDVSVFDTAVCQHAIGYAVTEVLGLPPEEGFVFVAAHSYSNQVFDYNFLEAKVNPTGEIEGQAPGPGDTFGKNLFGGERRKLGMTQGSWGAAVSYTIYASPTFMGFSSSDELYASLRKHLEKSVRRHVMTSVVISQGHRRGCPALKRLTGSTLSHISSDYLSTVDHTPQPSLQPSEIVVARPRNFDGVIAGTIVGITAFIMLVMYNAQQEAEATGL